MSFKEFITIVFIVSIFLTLATVVFSLDPKQACEGAYDVDYCIANYMKGL